MDIPLSKEEKARIEARNALRQHDWAINCIHEEIKNQNFHVTTDLLCELNKLAVKDICTDPRVLRTREVIIINSPHTPPNSNKVVDYVNELCQYVTDNWDKKPIHLAAYLLWRVNWIHPFGEGNGRTSRMISYMVLCIRLGFLLPGKKTIPEQIVAYRSPYYSALIKADKAYNKGKINLSDLEKLLDEYLLVQLIDIHDQAKV